MRGEKASGNPLAIVDDDDPLQVWALIMDRIVGTSNGTVGGIAEYRTQFQAAYPGVTNLDDFNFGHAARAIAAYLHDNFSSTGSPFDRYLAGDLDALSEQQKRGALQFFGATRKAKCSNCHRGPALTDNAFHGLAIPQVGPRLGDRGRGPVVASATEDFKFRTPALRNVALSGPYFHDGSAATLLDVMVHYNDIIKGLQEFDPSTLPPDFRALVDTDATRQNLRVTTAQADSQLPIALELNDNELADLVEFMNALTDPAFAGLQNAAPPTVPSGLPVED
jgi:cytochrome c peroxidase